MIADTPRIGARPVTHRAGPYAVRDAPIRALHAHPTSSGDPVTDLEHDLDPEDVLTPGLSTDVPHLPIPVQPGHPDYVTPDPDARPLPDGP